MSTLRFVSLVRLRYPPTPSVYTQWKRWEGNYRLVHSWSWPGCRALQPFPHVSCKGLTTRKDHQLSTLTKPTESSFLMGNGKAGYQMVNMSFQITPSPHGHDKFQHEDVFPLVMWGMTFRGLPNVPLFAFWKKKSYTAVKSVSQLVGQSCSNVP